MTYKPIRYSDHAAAERVKAGATRQEVRDTIIQGEPANVATTLGSKVQARIKEFAGRDLMVIYKEGANGIYILTLYWIGEYD